jgi:hypothetical protein
MDEFIGNNIARGGVSPSFLYPFAFKTAREEKERNQNICRCFFSKIKNHTENRYVD